jgi:hypothetical protein
MNIDENTLAMSFGGASQRAATSHGTAAYSSIDHWPVVFEVISQPPSCSRK